MTKFQVAYVPVGVPTFHLESAQKEFEKSIDLLNTITDAAIVPDKMLLSIDGTIYGGDEGCRTPVRKSKNKTFYECSFVMIIPFDFVHKQT